MKVSSRNKSARLQIMFHIHRERFIYTEANNVYTYNRSVETQCIGLIEPEAA